MGKKINMRLDCNKPIFISKSELNRFHRTQKINKVVDIFIEQSKEIFEILNPSLRLQKGYKEKLNKFLKKRLGKDLWVFYPWSGVLLHTLQEKELWQLRTNRNKNLITKEEQEKLNKFTVGIAGLSIGNSIALNLVYSGIANTIKIADKDKLETTNLNRVRARLEDIGQYKINITLRQIYEVDPYAKIIPFSSGLTKLNIKQFINGTPKLKLIFDAIDDFEMKIQIRIEARKAKIPVVMLTNLGDSILMDIERFDLKPKLPLFNGLIGNLPEKILSKPISEPDKHRYAVAIVGKENVPLRAHESIKEINNTLVGRPQLLSTVMTSGAIASYITRKIALRQRLGSGRKVIKFEDTFNT